MNQIQFYPGAINASDCIGNAWEMVKSNFGLYFGTSLVALLMLTCLPCVNFFIAGPVMCGIYFIFLRGMQNEPVAFGDMFKGFEVFVPAMVVGIIQAIPEVIGQGIRFSVDLANLGLQNAGRGDSHFQGDETRVALASGLMIFVIIAALIIFVLGIALRVSLFFAIPLIMEHRLGAVEAMKLSSQAAWNNLGGIIVLFIFEFLVALLGALALCVGIFVAIPVIYGANAFAYRQVFPQMQNFPNVPPSPDIYGGTYGTAR